MDQNDTELCLRRASLSTNMDDVMCVRQVLHIRADHFEQWRSSLTVGAINKPICCGAKPCCVLHSVIIALLSHTSCTGCTDSLLPVRELFYLHLMKIKSVFDVEGLAPFQNIYIFWKKSKFIEVRVLCMRKYFRHFLSTIQDKMKVSCQTFSTKVTEIIMTCDFTLSKSQRS